MVFEQKFFIFRSNYGFDLIKKILSIPLIMKYIFLYIIFFRFSCSGEETEKRTNDVKKINDNPGTEIIGYGFFWNNNSKEQKYEKLKHETEDKAKKRLITRLYKLRVL